MMRALRPVIWSTASRVLDTFVVRGPKARPSTTPRLSYAVETPYSAGLEKQDSLTKYLVTPSQTHGTVPGSLVRHLPLRTASKESVANIAKQKFHVCGPMVDDAENNVGWRQLSASWSNLLQDTYMGDGGKYRSRRYATFGWRSDQQNLIRMPHMPLFQTIDVNTLNGGKTRWFAPVEESTVTNGVFHNIISQAVSVFTHREIQEGRTADWFIEVDQMRIVAQPHAVGNPTPEGIHTDGTDYFLAMIVDRKNITGGRTTIYNGNREPMFETTLRLPSSAVFVNDREDSMHDVSPIACCGGEAGYRDVMILSFTNRVRPGSIERRFGLSA
ncbi:2OG-Fe dioxygenase-domain-containing protein, partial [Auriculariales sp. MPI-PUGE-AT-0066]